MDHHSNTRNTGMDDSELQAIRTARLQEMQRNAAGGGPSPGSTAGQATGASSNQNDAIMSQLLTPEAKQRLNRVRMVKPDRVQGVENYLLRLYQSGGLRNKVQEKDIVDILDKIANEERKNATTTIRFERRDYEGGDRDQNDKDDSEDDFFDE